MQWVHSSHSPVSIPLGHTTSRREPHALCVAQDPGYQGTTRVAPLHSDLLDVGGLLALGPMDNLELHLFPFSEGLEAGALDRGEVDKNILATLTSDEAITLTIVKPLDRTS